MKPLETLLKNAARSQKRICLSEGADPRAIEACLAACRDGIAQIVLVGDTGEIEAALAAAGAVLPGGASIQDPAKSDLAEEMAQAFYERRKHKGVTIEKAREAILSPHVFAALLVRTGHADGTLGGAVATTAEIVRTAMQVIGPKPGTKLISSFFLMLLCEDHHPKKGAFLFSDCALVIDPDAEEMAQIATDTAQSYRDLTKGEPRVAMLSFSTRGSARHASVTKVSQATELARAAEPDLVIDGEIQFDAAFVPEIGESKAGDGPLGGDANVFIFPNLDAGNIAYKITQRVGGANAIGPILQGLAAPANDLSRGCSAEDILHMIAVTAAQAEGLS